MDTEVWVPLVSGFGGALLGGAASLLGTLLSLRHSRKLDEIRWQREYRTRFDQEARQAIERFLTVTTATITTPAEKVPHSEADVLAMLDAFHGVATLAPDRVEKVATQLIEDVMSYANDPTEPKQQAAINTRERLLRETRDALGVARIEPTNSHLTT